MLYKSSDPLRHLITFKIVLHLVSIFSMCSFHVHFASNHTHIQKLKNFNLFNSLCIQLYLCINTSFPSEHYCFCFIHWKLEYPCTWPRFYFFNCLLYFSCNMIYIPSSFPQCPFFSKQWRKKNPSLSFLNFALIPLTSHCLARICSEQCLDICITSTPLSVCLFIMYRLLYS